MSAADASAYTSRLCPACRGLALEGHVLKSFGRNLDGSVRVRETVAARRCTTCFGAGRTRVLVASVDGGDEPEPDDTIR